MENNEKLGEEHIPRQEIGEQMDAVEERVFNDEAAAIEFFELVKHRLLAVNHWASLTGSALSTFQLNNHFGNPVERLAEEGDYIKIDIPGPGSGVGKGYDWVLVETIIRAHEAGMEVLTLRARPTANPLSKSNDTAHFLTEQATSTFQVKRIGKHIYAEEHGRNEQANTYTADTLDNLRNMAVGWMAMLGLSYPQWKSLLKGLLADP